MVRRIDKHTACQISQFVGQPVANYNLYEEARTTSHSGEVRLRKQPTMDFASVNALSIRSNNDAEQANAQLKKAGAAICAAGRLKRLSVNVSEPSELWRRSHGGDSGFERSSQQSPTARRSGLSAVVHAAAERGRRRSGSVSNV